MSNENEMKQCRHCRTEIPKGAKVCPNCRKKQSGRLKWIILIAVLVIAAAGAAGSSGNKEQAQKVADVSETDENQNTQQEAGGEEKTDKEAESASRESEEDVSTGEENQSAAEQEDVQDNVFAVGDVIETSALRISYLSAEQYASDNEFTQPKSGHVYYKMEFEFENISSSDKYISSYDFDCYADSYDMDRVWTEGSGLDATISPGRKTKGDVIFEVPEDSEEVILEYETNFWTENKIIFKVK